jgi:hypothetical protein
LGDGAIGAGAAETWGSAAIAEGVSASLAGLRGAHSGGRISGGAAGVERGFDCVFDCGFDRGLDRVGVSMLLGADRVGVDR